MKRITSFIFTLTLLLSIFTLSHTTAVLAAKTDYDLNLLSTLGIISEKDMQTPDRQVSRREFALYAARAIAIDEYQNTEKRYYTDVPVDDFAVGAINSLTDMGILTVSDDKRFRPDDTITMQEACKILVCALGYENYANASGGFPVGYMRAASDAKITKGASSIMDLYSVSRLIRNALEASVFEIDTMAIGKTTYRPSDTKTLFSVYHDIYTVEGTLNAIYGASTSATVTADENTLYIGEECFIAENVKGTDEYFGSYVKAYYRMKKDDYIGTVIFLIPDNLEDDITIDIKDFDQYENNAVKYYENGKRKRNIKVDDHIKIVYNGERLTSEISSVLDNLNKGTITLKDSNRTGEYDVMIIWDWMSVEYEQKAIDEDILYIRNSDAINLQEYYAINILDENGEAVLANKLVKGDILSVAASKNKKAIKITISCEVISGEIESIQLDEQELCIIVNSSEYFADINYVSNIREVTSLGKVFNFRLDVFGDIVCAEAAVEDTMKFGYLIRCDITADDAVRFTIFSSDNELLKFNGATAVRVDNKNYKTAAAVDNAVHAGGNAPQLIRFAVNEDGEICEVDTCYVSDRESEESSLYRSHTREDMNYKSNRFGIKTMVNGYVTKILYVPEDSEVETSSRDEFLFVGVWDAKLEADNKYNVESFKLSKNDDFPSVVVCRGGNLSQSYDEIILVDKIYEALNEDDERVTVIRGLQRTKFVEQVLEDDAEFVTTVTGGIPTTLSSVADIGEGDIIRCMTNRGGRAVKVNRLYDYSAGGLPTWGGITDTVNWYDGSGYGKFFQLSYGYVTKKGEQIVKWGYKNPSDFDEEYNLAILPIMVYDPNRYKNKVYSGTMDDIYSHDVVGGKCSRIIFRTSNSIGSCAVIYND